jgi:hypothetical protein
MPLKAGTIATISATHARQSGVRRVSTYNVAVVGATGLVGQEFLKIAGSGASPSRGSVCFLRSAARKSLSVNGRSRSRKRRPGRSSVWIWRFLRDGGEVSRG